MRRILSILLIGVVALVAACTDPAATPADPAATDPLPTEMAPTEMPVETVVP
jgi:hypothetical protein